MCLIVRTRVWFCNCCLVMWVFYSVLLNAWLSCVCADGYGDVKKNVPFGIIKSILKVPILSRTPKHDPSFMRFKTS